VNGRMSIVLNVVQAGDFVFVDVVAAHMLAVVDNVAQDRLDVLVAVTDEVEVGHMLAVVGIVERDRHDAQVGGNVEVVLVAVRTIAWGMSVVRDAHIVLVVVRTIGSGTVAKDAQAVGKD